MRTDANLSETIRKLIHTNIINQLTDTDLWMAVCRRERIEVPIEDCILCGALNTDLIGTPVMEVIIELMREHKHWKYIFCRMVHIPAHIEEKPNRLYIVPDEDVPFTTDVPGFYQIKAYNANNDELFKVDIGYLNSGSTLSTTAVGMKKDT